MTAVLLSLSLLLAAPSAAPSEPVTYSWTPHWQDDAALCLYRGEHLLGLWHVWRREWCPLHPSGA